MAIWKMWNLLSGAIIMLMVKKVCSISSNEKKLPNLKVLLDDYGFSQLRRIQRRLDNRPTQV